MKAAGGEEPLLLRSPALLLERLGIDEPGEIAVEAVAQACGATVVYEPLTGCEARLVGVGARAIITVDAAAPRPRQRFSAAHELGHWLHDRGRVAFACAEGQFAGEWGQANPERRANRFAAELLLPRTMFKRRARHQPITFATVRQLATEFQTSLTATAIRLVELGSFPSLAVCCDARRGRWAVASPLLPPEVAARPAPDPAALARRRDAGGPRLAPAAHWVEGAAPGAQVSVDWTLLGGGLSLALVWWRDDCPAAH